jgi:type II secretory pathway component PulM
MSIALGVALPIGRRGQLLAAGLTLICLAALWLGAAAPLLAWYAERQDRLGEREVLAQHMASLAEMLPALQQRLHADSARLPAQELLLQGPSDAVAGAALQDLVQDLAARAGATLSSAEILPGQAVGGFRRVGLQVSIDGAPWPALVRLLQSIARATPRMLVDDLQLRGAPALPQHQGADATRSGPPALDAGFTVFAFRAELSKTPAP